MKLFLIILLIPASIIIYSIAYLAWEDLKSLSLFNSNETTEIEKIQEDFDLKIPAEYIPIYMKAGEQYNVPWTLLAAHHRVETRFSTMNTLDFTRRSRRPYAIYAMYICRMESSNL